MGNTPLPILIMVALAVLFGILVMVVTTFLGPKKPTPAVPKAWRFVGVSNGQKSNSNNLWFQDATGNIFLIQGFSTSDEFVLNEQIQVLRVK